MKNHIRKVEEGLYPIQFNGKMLYRQDVDDVFEAYYHSEDALGLDGSVYVSEGDRIQPDGTWIFSDVDS